MTCPQCKTQNADDVNFCQRCGTRLQVSASSQATSAPNPAYRYESGASSEPPQGYSGYQSSVAPAPSPAHQAGLVPADKLIRWLAWVIDHLLVMFIIPIALIPLIGGLIVGALLVAFWLMRDVKGASPGKQLLGLRVVGKDGLPATREALIKRNLPFGLPHIVQIIPYLGIVLSYIISFPINVIEAIMVVATGERIGDRIAGTMVVKK